MAISRSGGGPEGDLDREGDRPAEGEDGGQRLGPAGEQRQRGDHPGEEEVGRRIELEERARLRDPERDQANGPLKQEDHQRGEDDGGEDGQQVRPFPVVLGM
jgi:hypothetical protein